MKKIEWETPNKMTIDTGHVTFDRQTKLIQAGNIIANTLFGWHIRGWNVTLNPVGNTVEAGRLFNYDVGQFNRLPSFIREQVKVILMHRSGWLYELRHWRKDRKIVHGYLLTTDDHLYLRMWETGPTYKSYGILIECAKYLTHSFDGE